MRKPSLVIGGITLAALVLVAVWSVSPTPASSVEKSVKSGTVEQGKTRQQVYKEIEDMFGLVPSMFKTIPDSTLALEWELFKKVQFEPGPIPNKYRELMGIALSAIAKCRYCILYHTEVAKLNGATDAEIEDAVHYAKSSAGWSTYINGMQIDYDQFKAEVQQAAEYVRAKSKKTSAK